MTQSKMQSAAEACANTAVGYAIAVVSQLLVFPMFDIYVPLSDNLLIGLWFTAISLVRSYALRRLFNRIKGAA